MWGRYREVGDSRELEKKRKMKHKKTFLGIGWKFPPTFNKKAGSVVLVSEEEDIKESLTILLSTKKGERVMLPEYGCDLHHMVFESIDNNLISEMSGIIENAILYFEPRIILHQVDIQTVRQFDGILDINIDYTIRKVNKRSNMVYPFYIIEGSDVRYAPQ